MDPIELLTNFQLSPLVILVMIVGLVEVFKKFAFMQHENAPLYLSMGLGMFFGALYFLQSLYPDIAIWVTFGVYCLVFGLVASGLFDLGRKFSGG